MYTSLAFLVSVAEVRGAVSAVDVQCKGLDKRGSGVS